MVALYVNLIRKGLWKIEKVSDIWRAAVEYDLDKELK